MTKISDLVSITAAAIDPAADLIAVVDMSETGIARDKKMTFAELQQASTPIDVDGTLAANSDTKVASQKAVKTYVDTAVTGLLDLKGGQDCSANPNYPAALKGDAYIVTVAGKIGGASGAAVNAGDVFFATADNAGGTQAAVGGSWDVIVHSGGTGSAIAVKDEGTTLTSGVASLNFTGTGVTATNSGTAVTINVPGSSAASPFESAPNKPDVANFTLQNAGTATATNSSQGIALIGPSVGSNIRFLKYTAGVADFSNFTIRCRGRAIEPFYDGGYSNCLIMRNSTSGKILIFGNYQRDVDVLMQNWTNYTTYSGDLLSAVDVRSLAALPWRRIRVVAGTIIAEVSPDGENWGTLYNGGATVASFLGSVDEVGIGVLVNGTKCSAVFHDFLAA